MEDGGQPLMEDDLQWKTTCDGRPPLKEKNHQWKTTIKGRQPSMEIDNPSAILDSPAPTKR